jgi:hypothetical protein
MNPALARLLWRLGLCCAAGWLAWNAGRSLALVLVSPLFGIALARPILDGIGAWHRHAHLAAWRDVAGYHHAYRGHTLRVLDDLQRRPWLHVDDLRRVLPGLPTDEVLQRLVGERCRPMARPPVLGIEAGALWQQLQGSSQLETLKFAQWLQRELLFPTERRRARQPPAADALAWPDDPG